MSEWYALVKNNDVIINVSLTIRLDKSKLTSSPSHGNKKHLVKLAKATRKGVQRAKQMFASSQPSFTTN